MLHRQAAYALAHPVFDPTRDIVMSPGGHRWSPAPDVTAVLTVNIGEE